MRKAPLNVFFKVNLNAVVNKSKKKMGIEVIIRDCKGMFGQLWLSLRTI
jgi:hypothetical protein